MKDFSRTLNSEYAGLFAGYWIHYGIVASFCSAFLIGVGYKNSEIGVMLAVASIISVILQPILADISDRSVKLNVMGVTQISTLVMMGLNIGLFIFTRKSTALWTVYMLLMAWNLALQPLFNSMQRKLSEGGYTIRFGMCRAGGSLGYSVFMAIMGTVVERYGTNTLPTAGMIVLAGLMGLLYITKKTLAASKKAKIEKGSYVETITTNDAEEINLARFVRRNGLFVLLNGFILILFFQNSILNNFMFQIISGVGGDSEDMGRVMSVMAFVEIPALFFFDYIRQKFSCDFLLKLASVAFVIKLAMIYAAENVFMIYLAHAFHMFSFSVFLPAIVAFINENMQRGEAVKGQAMYTTAITVANIFASVLGGLMLDSSGPRLMLFVSLILTAIGAIGVILTIDKVPKRA